MSSIQFWCFVIQCVCLSIQVIGLACSVFWLLKAERNLKQWLENERVN